MGLAFYVNGWVFLRGDGNLFKLVLWLKVTHMV